VADGVGDAGDGRTVGVGDGEAVRGAGGVAL